MKKVPQSILLMVVCLLITTACSSNSPSTIETTDPDVVTSPIDETEEDNSLDCLGNVISPIGQSIAEDFENVEYQQVITWFCDGAEFEDILVALETEALTDTSADEMLQLLADGLAWDEIWLSMGLTD